MGRACLPFQGTISMKKLYLTFIFSQLGLTTLMFVVWWVVGGIENAREMLFVISVLASAMAGNVLMADAYGKGLQARHIVKE
jgi:hypothetical protein